MMRDPSSRRTALAGILAALLLGGFTSDSIGNPNLMLVIDNSDSWNQAVYSLSYDPDVAYAGFFPADALYSISKSGSRSPHDFDPVAPDTPAAYFVASDQGQDGLYRGNYLNWIFFHATDEQRATIPCVTRIQVLKEALVPVIESNAGGLDIGLTIFGPGPGGRIVAECGTGAATLATDVLQLAAEGARPLGETLETVLDSWMYDGPDAAIQAADQRCFQLVITDGLPTMDLGVSPYLLDADGDGEDPGDCASIGATEPEAVDCSDSLDDVAYYAANTDLRPDLIGSQVAFTYVVGYREDGDLLQETAANGDGLFVHCASGYVLSAAIEAAMQDILRRAAAEAPVPTQPADAAALLRSVSPNPFNPQTRIVFDLPQSEAVGLRIFDAAGRLVRTLIDGDVHGAGRHEAVWNGRDDAGTSVASGTYFCCIEAGERTETRRTTLLK